MVVLFLLFDIGRYIMSVGVVGHVNLYYLVKVMSSRSLYCKLTIVPVVSIRCLWAML